MGLIRLLILAAIVYLIWRFYQSARAATRRRENAARPTPAATAQRMVKCPQCGVHVPEPDAVAHRGLTFCSLEHQRLYLEQHGP